MTNEPHDETRQMAVSRILSEALDQTVQRVAARYNLGPGSCSSALLSAAVEAARRDDGMTEVQIASWLRDLADALEAGQPLPGPVAGNA